MEFRVADTFTDSLARLTGEEQKSAKTTAFDLQLNPANPGMSFHKLDKAKDKNFWSVRVSSDVRLILHKTAASLLLCYVDHHDRAYRWAERRKLETHPTTGAAQWVEIRDRVAETAPFRPLVAAEPPVRPWFATTPKAPLFAGRSDSELLSYGVPIEWLADVRVADEDALMALTDHLPKEASEALLEIATGGTPTVPLVAPAGADPFAHPDAQRRFRVMNDVEELERALSSPWESGLRSCIRPSASGWSVATAARHGCPARRAREKPSWRCIAPCSSRASIRIAACCWPPFPSRWPVRCIRS